MQWGGVTFDANTKKLKLIGATFSVLWCYSIFFCFCCLNERNIVVLIFHHQQPLDFLPLCMKQVDAAHFFFFSPFAP